MNKLIKEFDVFQLADITSVVLREFFDWFQGNPKSIDKSVRAFFGWAFDHGYLGENPMVSVKLEMGNSENICKRHYIQNLRPGSGKASFNLRPFELVESGKIAV